MPDNLNKPDFLRLSDAQILENERQQAELRKKFNARMKLTPAELERITALTILPSLRESVELFPEDTHTRESYAKALSAVGEWEKAAEYAVSDDRKNYYTRVNEAIWRDDSECCDCPADIQILDNQQIQMPKFRLLKEVYSLKHGAVMNLLEQTCCGVWNVRALTDDIIAINRAAAHNENSNRKITDADLLQIGVK